MKKFLLILTLALLAGFVSKAQDDDNDKIRDKMREFIQKRLNLTRNEAERFTPVFVRYFREWRQTLKENRDDVLIRQQKIVDLRIRYRTEFREIVGEKRSNDVFKKQDEFIQGIQKMREEQMRNRKDDRPNKRFRSLIQ
jgi:energy-converting hydrogenase A subunit M